MEFKGISFKFVHNPKALKNKKNEFFVQLRITIGRISKYYSIEEVPKVPIRYWSGKENRWVKESHSQGARINSFLISKLGKLNEFLVLSTTSGRILTFDLIKSQFFMKGEVNTLNQFYTKYIKERDFDSTRTRQAYLTTLDTLNEYNSSIPIISISESLINQFIEWERRTKDLKDVTIDKHLTHLKTIVKSLTRDGFLVRNPLENIQFKVRPEKADRTSLSNEEVAKLEKLVFSEKEAHLERTRDVFVFQCLTGLYYKDVQELHDEDILQIEDICLIQGKRTKNLQGYIVPISKRAMLLMTKHKLESDELVFHGLCAEPVFNRQLKVVGKKAGLHKSISNKVGRHTFTEIAIASGIPRSYVSKMLGHTKESTTQHYYDINPTHFINQFIDNSIFS
ncbi:site-specific integrase [Algoriphagus antarcticus]|uniref:Site-specific recombinase XerD n=1 Tax=Algoriphagus antarcticus TaxID=238540 RepID=A0A3E0E1P8_9BACT|nr:site-specific integrase [Algoriphagus antarcticus]REG92141.1 site-specific recombinase XerD [Algoriphagus antarcticus]